MASLANRRRPPPIVRKSKRDSIKDSGGLKLYGLDAELAAKDAKKFDAGLMAEAQQWLETLTGEPFPGDFMASLKDGIILCKALNAIKPKTVKRISSSKLAFKQMENVSSFIKGCRKLGVAEYQLFTTPDLYEGKNRNQVIQSIVALGGVCQSLPGYSGPKLGTKQNTSKVTDKWQIGKNNEVSMMNMGSTGAKGMERTAPNFHSGPLAGSKYSGIGDTTVVSQMHMGSTGIGSKRVKPSNKGTVLAGAQYGVGDNSSVSQINQGSRGIGSKRIAPKYAGSEVRYAATNKPKSSTRTAPPPPARRGSTKNKKLRFRAKYDFKAVQHDEVDISEGDILESDGLTEEWTEGKNMTTGKTGLFPTAYVEAL